MSRTSADIQRLSDRVSKLETQLSLLGQPTAQVATGTTTSAETWGDVAAMQRAMRRPGAEPAPVDASGRKAMRAETPEQTARIDAEVAKLDALPARPAFGEAAKEAVLIVLLDLASRETPVSLGIARDRARKALGNIAALLGEAVKP